MNVSTYGAAPIGGGSGFPTMDELRRAARSAGASLTRDLTGWRPRKSPMTTAEVAAMRTLVRRIAGQAVMRSPWVRTARLVFDSYEAAQAAGIPLPEFDLSEWLPEFDWMPDTAFRATFGTKANPAWGQHPTVREWSYPFAASVFAPPFPNWTTGPGATAYRRNDIISRINTVQVLSGWAYYASIEYSADSFGFRWAGEETLHRAATSRADGWYTLTASGIPSLTVPNVRTVYPSASVPLTQIGVMPHALVGQVNRWRELVAPRQDGKPLRENGAIAAPPTADLFPAVAIRPRVGVVAAPTHQFKPPAKGEKEKKAVAKGRMVNRIFDVLRTMRKVGNEATEFVDFVTAIFYALPPEVIAEAGRRPSVTKMLQILSEEWEHLDAGRAVINLGIASASDYAIGKSTEGLRQQILRYRGDTPLNRERAWFYGPVL